MNPTVTYQEASTILAALRLLQDELKSNPEVVRQLPHFDDVPCLSPEQIDDLCNRLNCGEIVTIVEDQTCEEGPEPR